MIQMLFKHRTSYKPKYDSLPILQTLLNVGAITQDLVILALKGTPKYNMGSQVLSFIKLEEALMLVSYDSWYDMICCPPVW